MKGPGKYDDLATYVREQTGGQLVLVAVIGGKQGNGFSVQGYGEPGEEIKLGRDLARVLRQIAGQLEADA